MPVLPSASSLLEANPGVACFLICNPKTMSSRSDCAATNDVAGRLHTVASRRTRGPIDNISFGAPVWPFRNHIINIYIDPSVAVAIAHVFAVHAQSRQDHGECHNNVYDPKQTLPPDGRFCRDCLFLDAINALRLGFPM